MVSSVFLVANLQFNFVNLVSTIFDKEENFLSCCTKEIFPRGILLNTFFRGGMRNAHFPHPPWFLENFRFSPLPYKAFFFLSTSKWLAVVVVASGKVFLSSHNIFSSFRYFCVSSVCVCECVCV